MNSENSLPDRVKRAVGKNVSAFSRRSGVGESLLRQYISGATKPGLEKAAAIAAASGVSLEWLATGKGPEKTKERTSEDKADYPIEKQEIPCSEQRLLVTSKGELKEINEEQWKLQAEKYRQGIARMLEISKDDPSHYPAAVWSALIMELITLHGLEPSGSERIFEVIAELKKRSGEK